VGLLTLDGGGRREGRQWTAMAAGSRSHRLQRSGAFQATGRGVGCAARCDGALGLVGFNCNGPSGGIVWRWSSGHGQRRTAGGGARRRETRRAGTRSRRVWRLGLYEDTARESPRRVRHGHQGVRRGGLWLCPTWTRARQSSVGPVLGQK
jgi:hypothetical protein